MLTDPKLFQLECSLMLTSNLPPSMLVLFKYHRALANNLYPVVSGIEDLLSHVFFDCGNWQILLNRGFNLQLLDRSSKFTSLNIKYNISLSSDPINRKVIELFFDIVSPYVSAKNGEKLGVLRTISSSEYDLIYIDEKVYALLNDASLNNSGRKFKLLKAV